MSPVRTKNKRRLAQQRMVRLGVSTAKAQSKKPALRSSSVWISVLLGAISLAIYSGVIAHPFVNYDDGAYVTENQQVRAGLSWHTIVWAFTATEQSNWHPLTWISHALDCQLYGMHAPGHHLSSVLLHALNSVLLFLLLAKVTEFPLRSAAVAALFAIHPLNVESVAWIAERKNVLSMFFFLFALTAYGWYVTRPNWKRYIVVAILFLAGLASKPMVITLPCVLLLVDYWPLGRIRGHTEPSTNWPVRQKTFSSLVVEKVPLFALSAASAVITVLAQQRSAVSVGDLPFQVRVENALYSYAMYVSKTFWPVNLAVFYPHPLDKLAFAQIVGSVALLVIVSALVFRNRIKRPYLVTGWLWYLGTLIPVIGIIQVGAQGMADRYAYLPVVGLFLMLVWAGGEWAEQRSLRISTVMAIALPVLVVLAVLTVRQIGCWRSSYDLWAHALDVTHDNFLADDNMGDLLLKEGRPEALSYYQAAAHIAPWDPVSHGEVAASLQDRGDFRGAIREYEVVLRASPDPELEANAYASLGSIYRELGDYAKARETSERALRLDSEAVHLRISGLSNFVAAHPAAAGYFQLGLLFEGADQLSQARASYEQALALDANFEPARRALGRLAGVP